jgi:BA14K-like protein
MFPTLFGAAIIAAASMLAGTAAMGQSSPSPEANASIPLPNPTLLAPPPNFDCSFQAAKVDGGEPPRAQGDSDAALRRQLDYERQCYRHAEMILRDRLVRLQAAVGETIKAVNRGRKGVTKQLKRRMTAEVLERPSSEKQAHLRCNVAVCARFYRSFDRSDCTYRPYGGGARKTCDR